MTSPSHWILSEAQVCVKQNQDLTVMCSGGQRLTTSRLIFSLLLRTDLCSELISDENSYLVLDDVSLDEVNGIIEKAFFSKEVISVDPGCLLKFPWINWSLFKCLDDDDVDVDDEEKEVDCPY
jgi:hypothetical protein